MNLNLTIFRLTHTYLHTPLAIVLLSAYKDYQHSEMYLLCCQTPKYGKIQQSNSLNFIIFTLIRAYTLIYFTIFIKANKVFKKLKSLVLVLFVSYVQISHSH